MSWFQFSLFLVISTASCIANEELTCLVENEKGLPVSGAKVWLATEFDSSLGGWVHLSSEVSDVDGKVVFTSSFGEEIREVFAHHIEEGVGASGRSIGSSGNEPIKIVVSKGKPLEFTILDESENPVPDLRLRVRQIRGKLNQDNPLPFFVSHPPAELKDFWQGVTDENGFCQIEALPHDAQVYVDHDDSRYAQFPGLHSYKFQHTPNEDGVIKVALRRARTIRGRVILPGQGGVAGAVVRCLELYGYPFGGSGDEVKTDSEGNFALTRLFPTPYDIKVSVPESLEKDWASPLITFNELSDETMSETEVSFELNGGALIKGRVTTGANGEPLDSFSIGGTCSDRNSSPLELWWAKTEADGTYQMRLPPGNRKIYFGQSAPDGFVKPADVDLLVEGEEPYTVDFHLDSVKKSNSVQLAVIDENDETIEGATIIQRYGWSPVPLRTSQEGKAIFVFPASGSDQDESTAELYAEFEGEISAITEVKAGADLTLKVVKGMLSSVSGTIVDPDNHPIAGAEVVSPATLGGRSPATTDENGKFLVSRIIPQKNVGIFVNAKGYGAGSAQVDLTAGKTGDTGKISLPRANTRVAGTVVDEDGEPFAGVKVSAGGYMQPEDYSVTTDTNGTFAMDRVVDRWLWVEMFDEGTDSYDRVRMRAGKEGLQLELTRGVRYDQWREQIDLVGQKAPPLIVEKWYHSPPLAEDHGRGNVRLLSFAGIDRPLFFASSSVRFAQKLRNQYKHRDDVEIIFVHGPWPLEEVEEILKAEHPHISVPVAVEAKEGALSDAFGIQAWGSVVINRDGLVVFQGSRGEAAKSLRALLGE